MAEPVVVTTGLTKNFGSLRAVDDFNLTVQEGELFGLLGPNGAGKTTIVRMLCTLTRPSSGTATVAGYDVRKDAAEIRRRTGMVSEGVSLYKDLTIEENLKLLSRLYDLPARQSADRIRELLEMFDFREKAKRRLGALSSGWTKKSLICASILHRPSVLFLDEVTAGLDPQSAVALREFTRNLCDQEHVTVVWTTHYMGEPDKICDRLGIMFAGRLVKIGAPDELKHSVGGLSVVEVLVPNLSDKQLRRLEQKLNVEGLCRFKYENSKLTVTSQRNDLAQEVATLLVEVGAKIRTINTKNPSLEEAFIALTRDEEKIDHVPAAAQK